MKAILARIDRTKRKPYLYELVIDKKIVATFDKHDMGDDPSNRLAYVYHQCKVRGVTELEETDVRQSKASNPEDEKKDENPTVISK